MKQGVCAGAARERSRRSGPRRSCYWPLLTGVGCLAVTGTLRAQVVHHVGGDPSECDAVDGRVRIEVDVRSEWGASVAEAEVWAEARCAPRAVGSRSNARAEELPTSGVRLARRGDLYVASLPAWESWRIRVRALGYAEADSVVQPVSGDGQLVRVVLVPAPFVLPDLAAVALGEGTAIGLAGRTVQRVKFGEAAVTFGSVGEWLETLPGVTVRDRGPGQRQTIGIRGSRAEGVLVLLDGAPLNDPLTGSADLSLVPPSTLESAALVRGTGSARYGSGAEAGVLLLSSRSPGQRRGSLEVGLSSFGGWLFSGSGGFGGRALRVGGSVAVAAGRNDYAFRNRREPGAPTERRENADFRSTSAVFTAAGGPVRASLRYDGVERGAPGRMGTSLFDEARWRDAGWTGSVAIGSPGRQASVQLRSRQLEYVARPDLAPTAERVGDLRLGAEAGVLGARVSGRLSHERIWGGDGRGSADRTAVGASAVHPISSGRLLVEPAVGIDVSGEDVAVSPELGLELVATPIWRIWARAGRGYRLPTFADLYPSSGSRVQPNPDLVPETVALDAEAGLGGGSPGKTSGWTGSLIGFYRETHDPIVWLASAAAVWSPQNLDRLLAWGVEADATFVSEGRHWTIRLGGALTRSRLGFGDNRNAMPYQPEVTGILSVERAGRSRSLRGDVRFTGSRTTSVSATRHLPAFTLFDVSFAQALGLGGVPLELVLRVENVFDERYELVELFPEPGRRVEVRLRTR